jgi:hypothetical protein
VAEKLAPKPKPPAGWKQRPRGIYDQPDEYERASARWGQAASIPSQAASALTRSTRPDVAARLARLMLVEPSGWEVPRSEIYRYLARVDGPAEIEALRQIDERTLRRGGWVHLCDLVDQEMLKPDFKESGPSDPCGVGVTKGDYRVVGHGDRMWLRRRTEAGWGPPAVADTHDVGDQGKEVTDVSVSGARIVISGYYIELNRKRWRTVLDAEKLPTAMATESATQPRSILGPIPQDRIPMATVSTTEKMSRPWSRPRAATSNWCSKRRCDT